MTLNVLNYPSDDSSQLSTGFGPVSYAASFGATPADCCLGTPDGLFGHAGGSATVPTPAGYDPTESESFITATDSIRESGWTPMASKRHPLLRNPVRSVPSSLMFLAHNRRRDTRTGLDPGARPRRQWARMPGR